MTTDTKDVARWDFGVEFVHDQRTREISDGISVPELMEKGNYVLFTDHERVVGDFVEVVDVHRGIIADFTAEIETLRAAFAASRAEVEGFRAELNLVLEWATTEKKPLRAQEIESIRRVLEKRND